MTPKPKSQERDDTPSEQARLKELLSELGLDNLRLPANGVLTRQWQEFLGQLGVPNGLVNALLGGETTTVQPPKPAEPSPPQQAETRVSSVPPRPKPAEPSIDQEAEAWISSVQSCLKPPEPSPAAQAEERVTPAPLHPKPSEPSPAPLVTPLPPRSDSSDVNLAQRAEALAAQGDYEGAYRSYYQALQADPEDIALWYGLGLTLSHLNQRKETVEAFQYVVRRGRPDSEEVRLARRWLVDTGVLTEPATPTGVAAPPAEAQVTLAPSGHMPSEASPDVQREARVPPGGYDGPKAPRHRVDGEGLADRMMIEIEGSMTKDERERALFALMNEGHRMPPGRAVLITKVTEMRRKSRRKAS